MTVASSYIWWTENFGDGTLLSALTLKLRVLRGADELWWLCAPECTIVQTSA